MRRGGLAKLRVLLAADRKEVDFKYGPNRLVDGSDIRPLAHFDGTKQIGEPISLRNQILLQSQGPRRPYRGEVGVDRNVVPRLNVVHF